MLTTGKDISPSRDTSVNIIWQSSITGMATGSAVKFYAIQDYVK